MPLLSAFTPLGQLTLSSDPSHSERFYDVLIAGLGGNYDVDVGTRAEATCYARAIGMGHVRYLLEHAGKQIDPSCLDEMLADREREYGIVPGPNDSLPARRGAVGARKLLPRGARREAVEDALRNLLGSAFVAYRTTHADEIVNWPVTLGDQPQNLTLPSTPRKTMRLRNDVSINLGIAQVIECYAVDPVGAMPIAGDLVTIEPEINGITETVEVLDSNEDGFTAVVNNPHTADCLATTAPYPLWTGSQRASLIIVKASYAIQPETRRKVDELMQRIARGVSTWCVVQETTPTQAGPFIIGHSPIGATPFVLVSTP